MVTIVTKATMVTMVTVQWLLWLLWLPWLPFLQEEIVNNMEQLKAELKIAKPSYSGIDKIAKPSYSGIDMMVLDLLNAKSFKS